MKTRRLISILAICLAHAAAMMGQGNNKYCDSSGENCRELGECTACTSQAEGIFSNNNRRSGIYCNTPAVSENGDGGDDHLKLKVKLENSNKYVGTPNGQSMIKTQVGKTLYFDIETGGDRTGNRRMGVLRFYNSGASYDTRIAWGDKGRGPHPVTFSQTGQYCIIFEHDFCNGFPICNRITRKVYAWICVTPVVETAAPGQVRFNACYVGPESQCPDADCDCSESENPPPSSSYLYNPQYAYSSDPTKLYYEAVLEVRGKAGETYHWYKSGSSIHSPRVNAYGSMSTAEQEAASIPYRLQGTPIPPYPAPAGSYEEELYVRSKANGIFSDPMKLHVARNLRPIPGYRLEQDCLGQKVSFYNETKLQGSAPNAIRYVWHYGNGQKSRELNDNTTSQSSDNNNIDDGDTDSGNDLHVYEYDMPGDYQPVLQAIYDFQVGCTNRSVYSNGGPSITALSPKLEVSSQPVSVPRIGKTLSASAGTLSDAWLMNMSSIGRGNGLLREASPFLNGQRGVWRGDASFAYMEDRSQGDKINTRANGSYTQFLFDWSQGAGGDKWVRSANMTAYSAFGNELENKDALGLYSSALYGYGGSMATAVASNSRHEELAFTGFEEGALDQSGMPADFNFSNSGNLNILNSSTVALKTVQVTGGSNTLAIIDLPYEQIDSYLREATSPLTLSGKNIGNGSASFILDNIDIPCKYRNLQNPKQSIIGINGMGLDVLGPVWTGAISYYDEADGEVIQSADASITEAEAHTGKRSLWVKNNFSQPQHLMRLQAGNRYIISAWVKVVHNEPVPTYASAGPEGVGIKISGENMDMLAAPSGNIIEGWQRIEYSFEFTSPSGISLTFQKGGGNTYFDDIRVFPADGNMQSYVYDPANYRLLATLDNNNYATLYSYDAEGRLYLTRKETSRGIMTIQESSSYQAPNNK